MKIGVITFHWATNYGAVLQAYALQSYLLNAGHEVQIIDYVPASIWIKQRILAIKNLDFHFFEQENKLKTFRKRYLRLTPKRYSSHGRLRKLKNSFDCIIAGSDQIWNESFTLRGEGKKTLSYFLDFADDNVKRVGYAVSFGFTEPSKQYVDAVQNELKKFSAISVRESDGVNIISAFDRDSVIVCDPTLLLEKVNYYTIMDKRADNEEGVFAFILRENQDDAWKVARFVGEFYESNVSRYRFSGSMEEWIQRIHNSKFVVTNSFHGTVLSLIMNTPFIALTIKGSGMNSRITTLLHSVGLSTRIVEEYSEEQINEILSEPIDWDSVNSQLQELKALGVEFLKDNLYF